MLREWLVGSAITNVGAVSRHFAPEKLAAHQRGCDAVLSSASNPEAGTRRSLATATEGGGMHKPLTLTCHVCGRDFGTTSLEIHIVQCLEKRVAKQLRVRRHEGWVGPRSPVTRLTPLRVFQLPAEVRTDPSPAPATGIPVEWDFASREEFQA